MKLILFLLLLASCQKEFSQEYTCGRVYDKGVIGDSYQLHVFVGSTHYTIEVDSAKYERTRINAIHCF